MDPELGAVEGERNLKYNCLRPPTPDRHHSDTTEANLNANAGGFYTESTPMKTDDQGGAKDIQPLYVSGDSLKTDVYRCWHHSGSMSAHH